MPGCHHPAGERRNGGGLRPGPGRMVLLVLALFRGLLTPLGIFRLFFFLLRLAPPASGKCCSNFVMVLVAAGKREQPGPQASPGRHGAGGRTVMQKLAQTGGGVLRKSRATSSGRCRLASPQALHLSNRERSPGPVGGGGDKKGQ